jgi:hypothetical protein
MDTIKTHKQNKKCIFRVYPDFREALSGLTEKKLRV